jgi:hypothetical protein
MNKPHIRKCLTGQGSLEYVLLLGGIALAVILSMSVTGTNTKEMNCLFVSSFGGTGCSCISNFDDTSELDAWEGSKALRIYGIYYLTLLSKHVCLQNSRIFDHRRIGIGE